MSHTKGMIFAAGLGTRLRPLTNDRPKALVEVKGKSMLEWTVIKFIEAGITSVVINIHHFPEMMKVAILDLRSRYEIELLISDESDKVLETGGGLVKAIPLLQDADQIILHNADILSDIDLKQLAKEHDNSKHLATLVTNERVTSRYLLFNDDKDLIGWKNTNTNEYRWCKNKTPDYTPLAFCGIQV